MEPCVLSGHSCTGADACVLRTLAAYIYSYIYTEFISSTIKRRSSQWTLDRTLFRRLLKSWPLAYRVWKSARWNWQHVLSSSSTNKQQGDRSTTSRYGELLQACRFSHHFLTQKYLAMHAPSARPRNLVPVLLTRYGRWQEKDKRMNHASYHHHLLIHLYVRLTNEALIILSLNLNGSNKTPPERDMHFTSPAPVQSAAKRSSSLHEATWTTPGAGRTPAANLVAH